MAEGCPTDMRQPALGQGCEAEARLANVPMVAGGILQWPGAVGCLPLPAPASSSTPGSSVGTSSRFCLGADPAKGRGLKTLVGTWPMGTAWAWMDIPLAHRPQSPQGPRAHSLLQVSPPALQVPIVAPCLQEECQGPALPAAGQGRLVLVPPAPPPAPHPAEGKRGQGKQWGTHGAPMRSGRAQGTAGVGWGTGTCNNFMAVLGQILSCGVNPWLALHWLDWEHWFQLGRGRCPFCGSRVGDAERPLWLHRGQWAQGMSRGDTGGLLGFHPWWHYHQRSRGSPQPVPPQIPARRATSPRRAAPCPGWVPGGCPPPWPSAPPPSPAAGVPRSRRSLQRGVATRPPAWKHSRVSSGRRPVAPIPWAVPPPALRSPGGIWVALGTLGVRVHLPLGVPWLQEE